MGKPHLRSQTAPRAKAPLTVPNEPAFTHTHEGPILVLLFSSKPAQLDALARIETFYEGKGEGSSDSSQQQMGYLSSDKVREMGACSNYVAFNFTVEAVRTWLGLMWEATADARSTGPAAGPGSEAPAVGDRTERDGRDADEQVFWWDSHCTVQERHLLRLLHSTGCLDHLPFGPSHPSAASIKDGEESDPQRAQTTTAPAPQEVNPNPNQPTPTYLISALSSQSFDLTHERLHALFHLSPTYAQRATELYHTQLSAKIRSAIEWDLSARGYRKEMYADEWQAYVSEDPGEFGGKAKAECAQLRVELLALQKKAKAELGLTLDGS
ncbi:enhancer of mRNA decapping [Tilletia horrida]|uniref:Enhancer of mRNA decapping n=1 Tax=Tilletia horrida TaxID=155126 RepID=A0AAN6JNU9_9BASI|nr:enhancer of mRNA decapping [Tilletia horrida]KAK0544273.1 enhancer of mRNA decapping [Tilletia horrida]